MRRSLRYSVFLFALVAISFHSKAQLVIGDIAFTGINSTAPDDFSFVVLRASGIASGTQIKFTDRGWLSSAANCGTPTWGATVEGEITWTANTQIKYGVHVLVNTSALTSSHGTVVQSGAANVSIAVGDQLFAYTGTQAAPTMLAGIHMNIELGGNPTAATNWDNLGSLTGTQSNRPNCLTDGTYAFFFAGAGSDRTNARLLPRTFTGVRASDLAAVNNVNNWEHNNTLTGYTLPPTGMSGLPVDFKWLKASERAGKVQLDWSIATEENISKYVVERSSDGRFYTEIASVDATGKSTYGWSDSDPFTGTSFYRIRANDMSGTAKYSSVAIINLSKTGKGISVYPSVVRSNNFNLQLTNMPAANYQMNVINPVGQVTYSRNVSHAGGSAVEAINLPAGTPKGVYRVRLSAGAQTVVATIVVE